MERTARTACTFCVAALCLSVRDIDSGAIGYPFVSVYFVPADKYTLEKLGEFVNLRIKEHQRQIKTHDAISIIRTQH